MATLFTLISQQLVDNPPAYPFPPLTSFLTELSRIYPLVFFKPLFACATSDQEVTVVNHLCTLHVHAKYVQGYWVREVEMMCVALLNNPTGKVGETTGQWGVAPLGQLVLLVEFIGNVQNARRIKEAAANVWLFLSSFGPATFYLFLLVIRFFLLGRYQVCDRSGETLVKLDRRKGRAKSCIFCILLKYNII